MGLLTAGSDRPSKHEPSWTGIPWIDTESIPNQRLSVCLSVVFHSVCLSRSLLGNLGKGKASDGVCDA